MYCIRCGKRGTNRWPKHEPVACSLTCLGRSVVGEYWSGGAGFHCHECGGYTDGGCGCGEDEEQREGE